MYCEIVYMDHACFLCDIPVDWGALSLSPRVVRSNVGLIVTISVLMIIWGEWLACCYMQLCRCGSESVIHMCRWYIYYRIAL